jgi:hypothetical protein
MKKDAVAQRYLALRIYRRRKKTEIAPYYAFFHKIRSYVSNWFSLPLSSEKVFNLKMILKLPAVRLRRAGNALALLNFPSASGGPQGSLVQFMATRKRGSSLT